MELKFMTKIKNIDWDYLAPLGLGGRLTAKWFACGGGAAICISWAGFLNAYYNARSMLYSWERLVPGAVMQPFYEILGNTLSIFGIAALCMLPLALWHYYYHYQDSRSIYLMRRLPKRGELWRRCLALPLLGLTACALLAVLHLFLYFAVYQFCTPPQCLQPNQWWMLCENLFQ